MQTSPAGDPVRGIEPELLLPAPRRTRLRPEMVALLPIGQRGATRDARGTWQGTLVLAGIVFLGALGTSLPYWLGQTVPARVTYQAGIVNMDGRSGRVGPDLLLAQLTYDWRGGRRQETRRVQASLLKSFPNRGTIPIKVLRPWPALVWPAGSNPVEDRRFVATVWAMYGFIVAVIAGALHTDARSRRKRWQRRERLVSAGTPLAGRIVGYHRFFRWSIVQAPPRRGGIHAIYEYPAPPTRWRAGCLKRCYLPVSPRMAACLPLAGSPVTVLALRVGRGTIIDLYPLCVYQAVSPRMDDAPTGITPTGYSRPPGFAAPAP